ncbi:MAG: hypothetical protein AB7D51_07430 [Desulfovibrionaceae bacterium]
MTSSSNSPKNPAAVALGRLGGLKGGPARAKTLSQERRTEIARKAAVARWQTNTDEEHKMSSLSWTRERITQSDAVRPDLGAPMPFLRFTKEGNAFDHKTWFREQLFKNAPWRHTEKGRLEEAIINVDVTITGNSLGIRPLRIDFDPARGENHSAPTVHLHYDDAILEILASTNVIGCSAVVTADGNRYTLEIG